MKRFRVHWGVVAACWALYGVFSVTRLHTVVPGITWATAMRWGLPDVFIWAALTPIPFWLVRRFPFAAGRLPAHVALHATAAILVAVLSRFLDASQAFLIGSADQFSALFWKLMKYDFHLSVLIYLILLGITHTVVRFGALHDQERQTAELRARLSEARLQALRAQLRPHFLFNALHTISALMSTDPATGQRMVRRLGELLRMSLRSEQGDRVRVEEELDLVRAYLDIEQVRFRERLQADVSCEPDAAACLVPVFLLQPLVENAVRHGIAPRPEGGRMWVAVRREGDRLHLEVRDDGVGVPRSADDLGGGRAAASSGSASRAGARHREADDGSFRRAASRDGDAADDGGGIGLANIRARLKELYGDDHLFEVSARPGGGTEVTLSLPAETGEPDGAASVDEPESVAFSEVATRSGAGPAAGGGKRRAAGMRLPEDARTGRR